jgi:hypothetical protein
MMMMHFKHFIILYDKMSNCIKKINEFSTTDDIDQFLSTLYDCWLNSKGNIYYDSNILDILRKLLTIQSGKYVGYPNKTYIKLLYSVVMSNILSIREDKNLEVYKKFLISFFMYLEENAITGIISVKNKNILDRLVYLKKELGLKGMDEKSISNTHIIMTLL